MRTSQQPLRDRNEPEPKQFHEFWASRLKLADAAPVSTCTASLYTDSDKKLVKTRPRSTICKGVQNSSAASVLPAVIKNVGENKVVCERIKICISTNISFGVCANSVYLFTTGWVKLMEI